MNPIINSRPYANCIASQEKSSLGSFAPTLLRFFPCPALVFRLEISDSFSECTVLSETGRSEQKGYFGAPVQCSPRVESGSFIAQQGVIRASEHFADAAQGGDENSKAPSFDLLNCAGCKVGELGQFLLGQAG